MRNKEPELGSKVIATKYQDGDPKDHWAIGFLKEIYYVGTEKRYIVVNDHNKSFRANGFRRIKKISEDRAVWLISHYSDIEESFHSVWWWVRQSMTKTIK